MYPSTLLFKHETAEGPDSSGGRGCPRSAAARSEIGPAPTSLLPRTEAFRVCGMFSSFVPARLASWEFCPVTDGGRRLREVQCLDPSQLASGEEGGGLLSWRSVCCHPTQPLAQRGTAFHRVRGAWRTGVNKSGFLPNEAGGSEGPAAARCPRAWLPPMFPLNVLSVCDRSIAPEVPAWLLPLGHGVPRRTGGVGSMASPANAWSEGPELCHKTDCCGEYKAFKLGNCHP